MITYRHASSVQNHKCRRQTASWFVLRRDPCQRHEGEELGRPKCSHWDQLLCPYDEWSRETVHLIQVWVEWLRKLTSQLTGPKSRESKTEKTFFFLVGKSIRVLPDDCTELWLVGILSRWFYHNPDTMIFPNSPRVLTVIPRHRHDVLYFCHSYTDRSSFLPHPILRPVLIFLRVVHAVEEFGLGRYIAQVRRYMWVLVPDFSFTKMNPNHSN